MYVCCTCVCVDYVDKCLFLCKHTNNTHSGINLRTAQFESANRDFWIVLLSGLSLDDRGVRHARQGKTNGMGWGGWVREWDEGPLLSCF